VIQDLLESGIKLFYHYTDEQVRCDGAVDKFMIAARSFAAELEREKTSQRTHEHLLTKARRGLVVGGRVFGYMNVKVKEGERRVRVEYRINETEAKIVREIFQRYADGEGLRAIAQDLQARGVPAPKAGRRGTGVWSYSSIREMLRRERYRGRIIWGKHEKTYRGGTKVRILREAEQWVKLDVPELRIVDEDTWNAVQRKIAKHRAVLEKKTRGPAARYLLSGLARCADCGGLIHVARRKEGRANKAVYACSKRKNLGPRACKNSLRRPVESVDAAVVEWIRKNVLNEELIRSTLDELRARFASRTETAANDRPELEAQIATVKAELERLSNALLGANEKPEIVLRMIAERETRLASLNAQLANVRASPSLRNRDFAAIEATARERLKDLHGLFSRHLEAAHRVIEALLGGPLTFTAKENRYHIAGQVGAGWMDVVEGASAQASGAL
jgi:site-specific DNA recombinase